MIKFFRHIRNSLLEENKLSKYLLYAIGEIVLVVIGILIALQINAWNQTKEDIKKEEKFLLEIKENLIEDLQKVDTLLLANKRKLIRIDTAYHYLSLIDAQPMMGRKFSYQMPTITNLKLFVPTTVAFSNITATGKIDLLRSDPLRKEISRYYSDNPLDGVQNQIKVTTQTLLDNVAHQMINKTMMKAVTKRDFDVIPITEMKIHKDPKVLSGLFVLTNKTLEHNILLKATKTEVEDLVAKIDAYLKKT